jgi:hypothetical protein
MRHMRLFVLAAMLGGMIALPGLAEAQSRGRAVPRGSVRPSRPPAVVAPPVNRGYRAYRPAPYYYRPYRPGVSFGIYYGYPWYGPYAWGYPYGYYGSVYGYGYGYPGYGYPGYYGGYAVRSYGGVRLAMPQRDAEVYVDGYYAGIVDDFDGTFQQVNLEPGPHSIEVRGAGFEPVQFEVNVEPGRTITYRAALQTRP